MCSVTFFIICNEEFSKASLQLSLLNSDSKDTLNHVKICAALPCEFNRGEAV